MGWDILLFDLDGTLTDSGPGIMHAAKTALQSFGIDGLSEQELRYFVGPPLWESFGKYLPEEQISAAIDRFREYYRVTGWLGNEPYPGVRECLQALQGAGKRMYVATSKLETMARQVLAHFDLLQYFAGVCGGSAEDPEAGKKVNVVRRVLRENGTDDLSRAVLSGDREYDILGGHQAGVQTVGVLYGYGQPRGADGRGRGLPRRLPGGAAEPPAGITKNRTIPEDLVFGDLFMRTSC